MRPPWLTSLTRRLTRSQPRSLLSRARSKSARSRVRPSSCRRVRSVQISFSFSGGFCPVSLPLFQGTCGALVTGVFMRWYLQRGLGYSKSGVAAGFRWSAGHRTDHVERRFAAGCLRHIHRISLTASMMKPKRRARGPARRENRAPGAGRNRSYSSHPAPQPGGVRRQCRRALQGRCSTRRYGISARIRGAPGTEPSTMCEPGTSSTRCG
jgi:hypothetical protein